MQTIKKQCSHFVWLMLLAALFLTGCKPQGVRALLKGKRLLDDGKYQPAIEQLRTATSLLPTNALAYNYLGLALHQAGESQEAEKAYLRALTLNHELVEVRYNLGCLWLAENKPEQAKAELTAFTLRRVNSPEGWLKLGTAQLRTHEPTGAERSFAEVLRLSPNEPEATTGIGLARVQRNRPQEAVQYFEKALKQQPDYAPALLNLAVVAQDQLKDKKSALQYYQRYLALKPPAGEANRVQAVIKQIEQELAPPPPPVIASAVTNTTAPAHRIGPTNTTKPANLEVASLASPAKPTNTQLNAPATQKSEVATSPSPKTQPKAEPVKTAAQAPTQPTKVATNLETAKPATAANLTAAAKPNPEPPSAPVETVTVPNDTVFKAAEDTPSKLAVAQEASAPSTPKASLNPGADTKTPPPKKGFIQRLNPVRLFSKEEKPSAAESTGSPTQSKSPSPTPLADEPQTTEDVSKSFPRYSYKSPPKPEPGNRAEAERAFAQGVQAHNAHRLPEAISAYRRSVQLDPSYFDAYYNMGLAAGESGNSQTALSSYESALAIRPESLDARYSFALALKQSGYAVDAAAELRKLLSSYPNDSRAHLALGNLYDQQFKDPAKAKVHYLQVLEHDPRNPEAGAIRYWLAAH